MNESTIQHQLGRAIRARREAGGFSQDSFADHIEMHRAYYSAIERGERNLTLATLHRLARGFGVSIHILAAEAKI